MTVSAFLGMLAASQTLGEFVCLMLRRSRVDFDLGIAPYPEREGMWAEQLELLLVYVQTPDLGSRFITEVLTVMYGNLLRYYGDEVASLSLLKDIVRPNLYDELYGLRDPRIEFSNSTVTWPIEQAGAD